MKVTLILVVTITSVIAVQRDSHPRKSDEGMKSLSAKQRIYDIIQTHEGHKFGEHGGHEYEEGEIPRSMNGRKSHRIGYLPVADEGRNQHYYASAPKLSYRPNDNIYRENVAAFTNKGASPIHLGNAPKQVVASPLSHSHYAIIDPKSHDQYVVYGDPLPSHKAVPVPVKQKHAYILEEEPNYIAPHREVIAKPPVEHHTVPHPTAIKSYNNHYDAHHKLSDKSHHSSGHGHYGDNSLHKESGHKSSGKHDIAGHKAHSATLGHHDEHDHHHNRAHYERDRGYHYEKAYAYDRVRASHDIGSKKDAHSAYKANHGHESHKNVGDHGDQSYVYFNKHGQHGGHDYHDNKNSLYKSGHHGNGQGYDNYEHKYLPHYHAYEK